MTPQVGKASGLRGRDRELASLTALLEQASAGRSGAIVVSGEAGVGKTALLNRVADLAPAHMRVERMIASESEMELAFAGLQLLCAHMMHAADRLPSLQRESLEIVFGLRAAKTPNPFIVGLAVLRLLTQVAAGRPMMCIVDDAQWLDDASARTLAFVARRLSSEGIALVLAVRVVDEQFADLPQLALEGLGDDDSRELLRGAFPGAMDTRVRDQLITEARGNPLALQELPRALSPAEVGGGFALVESMPITTRIEQSLLASLEPLPQATRTLLLLAAADATGDPDLLWRAAASIGLGPENLDLAVQADALVIGTRVMFRHPLIRSAVYRAASAEQRRSAHAALADATLAERDPDRRAWHRASATTLPDETVATDLERSAERARRRGGVSAVAAFLERAAELSPQPARRAERLIAAAEAKHDAGAPESAMRLLDDARDLPLTALQQAVIDRLRARSAYALRRDRSAPRQLLLAARALEPHDQRLARDTYMEALSAAVSAGRLGEPGAVAEVADAILDATADDRSANAQDLVLRGQALLVTEGQAAALPTLQRATRALLEHPPDALELHWMWFAARAAQDLWDAEGLRKLADRQVVLARAAGILTVLPAALNLLMVVRTFDGRLDAAEATCDEIDTILSVTGHPIPKYGRIFLAAYRGQVDVVERYTKQLRIDGHERGEGYALTVANFAEAIAYNGAGRYEEALASARGELSHEKEFGHAMRTLLELIEAATRTGERAIAQEAVERLESVTLPVGTSEWALAAVAFARAQLREGDAAERLYHEAIERFQRIRVPILAARSQLLLGEMLRRLGRRSEAREQLKLAYEGLSACGMTGFAERAKRELQATGETVRTQASRGVDELTEQEFAVARLARDGLTNREIAMRLFISARTAEYHLRKVFVKLGIGSRTELKTVLGATDTRS
jgi:DNA-binding CsgD family transcriptional regulator